MEFKTKPLILTYNGGHDGTVVKHSPPTSEVGGSNPGPYVGNLFFFSLMVGSLQYRTLTKWRYWFPLPIKLSVVI